MKTIIKAAMDDAFSTVRPLAASRPAPSIDPDLLVARERIAQLETALSASTGEASRLRSEVDHALERGLAEGKAAGESRADQHEQDRLGLLEQNLIQAQGAVTNALRAAEGLAVLIARDCLDKLLARPDFRTDIVHGLIRAQMAQVSEKSILSIRVSTEDFGDRAAVVALQSVAGAHGMDVRADPALATGDCIMDFRLGEADIGLKRQWTALGALLGDMAEERENA